MGSAVVVLSIYSCSKLYSSHHMCIRRYVGCFIRTVSVKCSRTERNA